MEIIKDGKLLEIKYEPPTQKKKIEFEFQALGVELEPFYGKAIWSQFYKHSEGKIRDAHKICLQRGITKFAYLLGVLKNLK